MRCLRLALVFAAAVFVVAATEAQPQPPSAVPATPLAVVMLSGIDDPVVVADLKLKDEQVKALVARRKELWDEAYTTAPNKFAETATARTEATDALLKKTLTADQYKRAVQLGAQSVLSSRGFRDDPDAPTAFRLTAVTPTVLRRYPELVVAFKLTDDQKKQLAAPTPKGDKGDRGFASRSIAVSKEQSDAAKEFLGPVAKAWQTKSDPRVAGRSAAPAGFSLLEAKDVRTELKLSDADAKAFTAIAEKWQKLSNDRFTDLSPKEADEQATALKTETEKALAALKPEQATRLKQITFQVGGTGGFPGARAPADMHIERLYTNATVAKEVAVTEKQIEELKLLRDAFEKDAAAVLGSADAFAAAEKKVSDLAAARRAKGDKVLTADQTAKLRALVGEPFTGNTRPDRLGADRGQGSPLLETLRAATFGKYSTELLLLSGNKSIQEELKLDEKQIKQATEMQTDIANKFRVAFPGGGDTEEYTKSLAERSKAIGDALGKVLTEDQAKRFRQLMLQSRERESDPRGFSTTLIRTAVSYPGVAEEVKFSDEQKKKLLAGTAVAEVLTADQKSAIQKMLGEPFKGDFLTRPTGLPPLRQTVTAVTRLLATTNVKAAEEALKLTDDQSKALATARAAYQKAIQVDRSFGGDRPVSPAATRRAASEAFDKAVAEALTAEQKQRLAQLVVQADAAADLVATLTAPEMAKKLELTADQTAKLTALDAEADRLQGLRTTHLRVTDQKLGLQMRDAADDRVTAVLNDTQKKKWKELTGEPLPGLQKAVPARFGPGGGFAGPGGFGGPGGGGFVPPGP